VKYQVLNPNDLSHFIAEAGQASVGFLRSLITLLGKAMKPAHIFYLAMLASVVFAVIAEGFGYGLAFAAVTFAMQLPLLIVMMLFARAAERSGRRQSFVGVSLLFSVLFVAAGGEDIVLCMSYGIMHASDSGITRWGIEAMSMLLLVIAAASWLFLRLKEPKQSPLTTRAFGPRV
jgi:hypothetical protein